MSDKENDPNGEQDIPLPAAPVQAVKDDGQMASVTDIPRNVIDDPLLDCLQLLCAHHNRNLSGPALTAGLPLKDGRLTPELFVRAAERAQLSARVVRRPLNRLSRLLLPVVLMLKDGQACLLLSYFKNGRRGEQMAEIQFGETGGKQSLPVKELDALYGGYTILTHAETRIEQRVEDLVHDRPKSWFWGTLFRYKGIYGQVAVAAVLTNLFALASPLFVMNVYDRVVPNNAFETLWVLAIGAGIVFGFDFLMRSLRGYFIDIAGKKADVILAGRMFQHVLGLKMSHRPQSTGAMANQVGEFESLRDFFSSATLVTIIDLPFMLLFVFVIYTIGGPIAYIPMAVLPLLMIVALIIEIPMRRAVGEAQKGAAQKQAVLVESLSSMEMLKAMSAEGLIQDKWENYVARTARAGMTSRLLSMMAVNFTAFATQMSTICIVVAGVYAISEGLLSMGGLIACTILTGRALAPVGQFANLMTRFHRTRMALKGLNDIMAMPVERPVDTRFLHRPELQGQFQFADVGFRYPNQELFALQDITLNIAAGEKVGIIGRIGSGKTTLQKMMLGLYVPEKGTLRVDGTNINQIDPVDLRRNIAYVSQDSTLFYGSVRDNIAMAAPWADDAAILDAAQRAGVDSFVSRHPDGYDMLIGERGDGLSGGQRQSITIARALLTDAPIVLLDEPSSAMDNSTERGFMQTMSTFCENRTLILVTHKASLLALVDRLIVMDNGQVVADGPREQVLKALSSGKLRATSNTGPKPVKPPHVAEG